MDSLSKAIEMVMFFSHAPPHGQNDLHQDTQLFLQATGFSSACMAVFATDPLPEKCLFKYCTIPTSTFIIYRFKKNDIITFLLNFLKRQLCN